MSRQANYQSSAPLDTLTESQARAWAKLQRFVQDPKARIFILRGYAGTGKTTLLAKLAHDLISRGRPVVLLAPTGRAARVLTSYSQLQARTIHSQIYDFLRLSFRNRTKDEIRYEFVLSNNQDPVHTVYLVDEASMISDHDTEDGWLRFGSGRLLSDLVQFVFGPDGDDGDRKLVLAGDAAQLPPVYSSESPALDPVYVSQNFGYTPYVDELTDVVRTACDHPLSRLATFLRECVRQQDYSHFVIEPDEQHILCRQNLDLDTWVRELESPETADRVLITHSNVQAHFYNLAIRTRLFPNRATLVPGDRLVVMDNTRVDNMPFLNGDILQVLEAPAHPQEVNVPLKLKRKRETRHVVLQFRPAVVRCLSDDSVRSVLLLENLLHTPARNISDLERRALFVYFCIRNSHLRRDSPDFAHALLKDPYFNAVHVKYAYALTCHKAQGGEWSTVAVDFDTSHVHTASAEFSRWAYTAVTRARRTLLAIHPPLHTPDLALLQRLVQKFPQPTPYIVRSTAHCEIGRRWEDDLPAERIPIFWAIRERAQQSGLVILSVQNRERRLRCLVKLGGTETTVDFLIGSQNMVSQVIPDSEAAAEVQAKLIDAFSPIEHRPVITKSVIPEQLELGTQPAAQHDMQAFRLWMRLSLCVNSMRHSGPGWQATGLLSQASNILRLIKFDISFETSLPMNKRLSFTSSTAKDARRLPWTGVVRPPVSWPGVCSACSGLKKPTQRRSRNACFGFADPRNEGFSNGRPRRGSRTS